MFGSCQRKHQERKKANEARSVRGIGFENVAKKEGGGSRMNNRAINEAKEPEEKTPKAIEGRMVIACNIERKGLIGRVGHPHAPYTGARAGSMHPQQWGEVGPRHDKHNYTNVVCFAVIFNILFNAAIAQEQVRSNRVKKVVPADKKKLARPNPTRYPQQSLIISWAHTYRAFKNLNDNGFDAIQWRNTGAGVYPSTIQTMRECAHSYSRDPESVVPALSRYVVPETPKERRERRKIHCARVACDHQIGRSRVVAWNGDAVRFTTEPKAPQAVSSLQWSFPDMKWGVDGDFAKPSDLNGCNGEWTNEDCRVFIMPPVIWHVLASNYQAIGLLAIGGGVALFGGSVIQGVASSGKKLAKYAVKRVRKDGVGFVKFIIQHNLACMAFSFLGSAVMVDPSHPQFWRDFSGNLLVCSVLFALRSSLNGNNGSWTNTDDSASVDETVSGFDAIKAARVLKEAKNHLHQRAVAGGRRPATQPVAGAGAGSGGTNVHANKHNGRAQGSGAGAGGRGTGAGGGGRGRSTGGSSTTSDTEPSTPGSEPGVPAAEPPKPDPPKEYSVSLPPLLCLTYGELYMNKGGVITTIAPHPLIADGTEVEAVEHKPGYCKVIKDKGEKVKTRGCVERRFFPSYHHHGIYYPEEDFDILPSVHRALVVQFGPGKTSLHQLSCATHVAMKLVSDSDSLELAGRLAIRTVAYYTSRARYLEALRDSTLHDMNPGVSAARFGIEQAGVERRGLYTYYHEDADEVDYELRDDYRLSEPLNQNPSVIECPDEDGFGPSQVRFPRTEKKRFSTVFCKFLGNEQPGFKIYSPNDQNIHGGMKRILGRRPDEEQLRYNCRTFHGLVLCPLFRLKHPALYQQHLDWSRRAYPSDKVQSYDDEFVEDDIVVEPVPPSVVDSCRQMAHSMLGGCERSWCDYPLYCARSIYYKAIAYVCEQAPACIKTVGSWAAYAGISFDMPALARIFCAMLAHAKQQIRQNFVKKILLEGVATCVARAEINIKPDENAKIGKPARLTVNYNEGTMQQNEVAEQIKIAIHGEHTLTLEKPDGHTVVGRVFIMSKDASWELEHILQQIVEMIGDQDGYISVIKSDDRIDAIVKAGVLYLYNVDISSNDSGKDKTQFGMVHAMCCRIHRYSADVLLNTMLIPMRLSSIIRGGPTVKVEFKTPFMGSGNVLTSVLNHPDSALQAAATFAHIFVVGTPPGEAAQRAARHMGQIVTVETASVFEELQFLKHSPTALTNGHWVFLPNVSTLFRSFVSVKGVLEAKHLNVSQQEFMSMSDGQRFDALGRNLIKQWCHYPKGRVIDAFRERFSGWSESDLTESESYGLSTTDHSTETINEYSFNARYHLCDHDIDVLVAQILQLRCGDECSSDAVAAFYRADYQMK